MFHVLKTDCTQSFFFSISLFYINRILCFLWNDNSWTHFYHEPFLYFNSLIPVMCDLLQCKKTTATTPTKCWRIIRIIISPLLWMNIVLCTLCTYKFTSKLQTYLKILQTVKDLTIQTYHPYLICLQWTVFSQGPWCIQGLPDCQLSNL